MSDYKNKQQQKNFSDADMSGGERRRFFERASGTNLLAERRGMQRRLEPHLV